LCVTEAEGDETVVCELTVSVLRLAVLEMDAEVTVEVTLKVTLVDVERLLVVEDTLLLVLEGVTLRDELTLRELELALRTDEADLLLDTDREEDARDDDVVAAKAAAGRRKSVKSAVTFIVAQNTSRSGALNESGWWELAMRTVRLD